MPGGADDLDEVVRGHVGGHPDGDPAGAVDEQVRERGGEDLGLGLGVVVVRDEVDGVFVQPADHEQRGLGHPRLGVAGRRGAVVERPEVAVAVDEGEPHGERLGHPDQGVVDRLVAVRVVLAHDLADDPLALDVGAVGAQPQLAHPEQDAPLDRLQPVARVREGAGVDDGVRVLEEGVAHLLLDVDVDDALLDRLVRRGSTRAAARHTGWCSLRGWGRPHLGPPQCGRPARPTGTSRTERRGRVFAAAAPQHERNCALVAADRPHLAPDQRNCSAVVSASRPTCSPDMPKRRPRAAERPTSAAMDRPRAAEPGLSAGSAGSAGRRQRWVPNWPQWTTSAGPRLPRFSDGLFGPGTSYPRATTPMIDRSRGIPNSSCTSS